MKHTMQRATISLLVLMFAGAVSFAASQEEPDGRNLDLWNDPTFEKQFLGTLGVQSDVEPGVDLDEQPLMMEVLELFQSDDLDGAIAKLQEILSPPPVPSKKKKKKTPPEPHFEVSARFDFLLGSAYFQKHLRGDESEENLLDQAAPQYENAIEKFPSYLRAHKNLGLIHVQRNRYDKAIPHLSRAIELGAEDGLVYGLLGWCYLNTGQYLSAESALRTALLLQADVVDWKVALAQAQAKQGKYAEAVTLTEELIAGDPERSDFWLLQANAYIGLGKSLEAAKNYEMLRRMGMASASSMHVLGDIYVNHSLWDLATGAYEKALEIDPNQSVERPLRNVEILAQRGALDQSKSLLAQTKNVLGDRLDGDDRKNLLKLEARIAVADGTGGEAVTILEEVVALDPLDGDALMLLGEHYARIDDHEQAIFYYERAESLEGFEADAKVRHAQILVAQSRYDEAVPLLKRAQEIKPRDEVGRYLEQVERIARSRR